MAEGWQRTDSNETATDETRYGQVILCHTRATGDKAGYCAMASPKASTMLLPLACEHSLVAGGIDIKDYNKKAKQYIATWKASGIVTLPALIGAAREVDDPALRRAILCRLGDRLSRNNPFKASLYLEGQCCI